MLRKKTNGVARRPQRASLLSKVSEKSVDRRSFLKSLAENYFNDFNPLLIAV